MIQPSKRLHWVTLSVSGDGIGVPKDPADARPGLGTGIVESLARQLDARVITTDADPGTKVTIVYA